MTSQSPEACPCSNIPKLDGRVIAGREEHGLLMNLDLIDKITVPLERRALARRKVPNLDGGIDRSGRQDARIEIQGDHAVSMSLQCPNTLSCVIVPDLEGPVHRACDQLCLVKVERSHTECMSGQRAKTLARLNIPDFDRIVVGSSDQEGVVELKTHDAVCMSAELFHSVIAFPPVALDDQTLRVYILP